MVRHHTLMRNLAYLAVAIYIVLGATFLLLLG